MWELCVLLGTTIEIKEPCEILWTITHGFVMWIIWDVTCSVCRTTTLLYLQNNNILKTSLHNSFYNWKSMSNWATKLSFSHKREVTNSSVPYSSHPRCSWKVIQVGNWKVYAVIIIYIDNLRCNLTTVKTDFIEFLIMNLPDAFF